MCGAWDEKFDISKASTVAMTVTWLSSSNEAEMDNLLHLNGFPVTVGCQSPLAASAILSIIPQKSQG